MNKDELGRMLDMVDEKYIAGITDTEVRLRPVKRRFIPQLAVSAAAVAGLAVGITLYTGDSSIEEDQGVTGDSESLMTDIIPVEETSAVLPGEVSCEGLFEYPLDMGGFITGGQSGAGICNYFYYPEKLFILDIPVDPGDELTQSASMCTGSSGERLSAYVMFSVSGENGIYAQLTAAVTQAQGWEYSSPAERHGEQVFSFYCEKMDGLHLWAYFERDGRQYSVSSANFDRETAAAVLDGLITGEIDLDILTPENARNMTCNVPLTEAAEVTGFDRIYTGALGGAYPRDDTGLYDVQYDGRGNITGSAFHVVYSAGGGEFAVSYSTGSMADVPDETIPDISHITSGQLNELYSSGQCIVTAGDEIITVTGDCSREMLEALFENLRQ